MILKLNYVKIMFFSIKKFFDQFFQCLYSMIIVFIIKYKVLFKFISLLIIVLYYLE